MKSKAFPSLYDLWLFLREHNYYLRISFHNNSFHHNYGGFFPFNHSDPYRQAKQSFIDQLGYNDHIDRDEKVSIKEILICKNQTTDTIFSKQYFKPTTYTSREVINEINRFFKENASIVELDSI